MALFNICKTVKLRLLFALLVMTGLVQTIPVYCQNGYIVKHYNNETGLPANGIKGIELDKKTGFLWVGTQAGLVRFDGVGFKKVGPETNAAVSRTALIGKNRQGTIYYENDNFSVYRIVQNRAEWVMTDTLFYPFHQSKVWQSIYNPVEQLRDKLKSHRPKDFIPPWIIFHDEAGVHSSFSFVQFGRAYHYDATADTLFAYPGFNQMLKVGRDLYLVDTALTLWRYDHSLRKPVAVHIEQMPRWKGKKEEQPKYIWQAGMKDPLMLLQQSVWKLEGQNDTLRLSPLCQNCYPRNAEISSAQVWEERQLLFLGSAVNGLYVVKTPFFPSFNADRIVGSMQTEYAQAEIKPGLINTGSGSIFNTEGKPLPGRLRLPFHPKSIYRDQKGDHWSHLGDTVIRFHSGQDRYTRIPLRDGSEKIIFAESRNRLFVLSDRAFGEIAEERYTLLYKLPYLAGDLKNWLNPDAAVEWKPGIMAIATEKLLLFNTVTAKTPDSVPIPGLTTKVRALLKYGDYLLIGTYGQGYYMFKDGVVKKMPLDKNHYLSYTHCFVPDGKGFCWISTNHGLFKVRMDALVGAYEKDLDEIYFHYFGKEDGIENTEFNGGCQPCALQLSNGLLSFPSVNGIIVFDPRLQHASPPSGPVFIDEIAADSRNFHPGDSLLKALPHNLLNIRITISLPHVGNNENIYFSYKLTPYNQEWETQDILQNNILQFGGLKPGHYKLYLRVRNGYGADDFETTSFEFNILPPWYNSWWFYTLCGLSLTAFIWGLVKWRTARINHRKKELQHQVNQQTEEIAAKSEQLASQLNQLQYQQEMLEEDNKIKARLIGIISHDMMSPLRFMSYLGQKLRDSFSSTEPAHKTADSFVKVTQELEGLTLNMLSWIRFHHSSIHMKPERFNVHEMVAESIRIPATLAREKGIQFYNEVPHEADFFQYRQAIGVIIYNLTMNAMKYTSAGEVRVSCGCTENALSLTVSDTGPGMLPELVAMLNRQEELVPMFATGDTNRYQFGYVIIKDLLQLIEGTLQVASVDGEGTQITVKCFLSTEAK